MNTCQNCQAETKNPKFCSRSCNTSYNNRLNPKIKKKIHLCQCGNNKNRRAAQCTACGRHRIPPDITLGEAINLTKHRPSIYNTIRSRARIICRRLGLTKCSRCGYDKHVEICHIKPIHTYDLTTPLSIINDISNLKVLCPNCHWELDNLESSPQLSRTVNPEVETPVPQSRGQAIVSQAEAFLALCKQTLEYQGYTITKS